MERNKVSASAEKTQGNSEKSLDAIRAKRQELAEISKIIRNLVVKGKPNVHVNEILRRDYASKGHTDLRTLKEWRKAGYSVKRGEHALLLWGQPKAGKQEDEQGNPMKFFPIRFMFSNLQVYERR